MRMIEFFREVVRDKSADQTWLLNCRFPDLMQRALTSTSMRYQQAIKQPNNFFLDYKFQREKYLVILVLLAS